MKQADKKYLRPTSTIDCDSESIKRKAELLTKSQQEVTGKAKNLFYFVRDEIKYNLYVPSDLREYYRASRTLGAGEGFCVQKAVLLLALVRAVDIPARLHLAAIRNHLIPDKLKELLGTNQFPAHGYTELYIEGKWVKATPTFDLKTCQKNRIIPVEFDGKHDALLHSHNQDRELHIEYVEDHGYYDDLPFEKIISLRKQVYDADIFERLRQASESKKARAADA